MLDKRSSVTSTMRIGSTDFSWGTQTFVMGVINATPDSFSGDGLLNPELAAEQARVMVQDGADLIDVGAESSRPGHHVVDVDEEWNRLELILGAVRDAVDVPITIDTTKATVAERAFDVGADALNDINGLRMDSGLAPLLVRGGWPAVLMHNQRGRDSSGDVILDARSGLEESLRIADRAGVDPGYLLLDPGFGFGWGVSQNLELLRRVGELRVLNHPLLIGTSRKSTIGAVLERSETERQWGTAATVALAVQAGVDIVRVHDVREMVEVARMSDAVSRYWSR